MTAPRFTDADRLAMQDAAHDIAALVAEGLTPRPAHVERFRALVAKRDTWLAAHPISPAPTEHLADLEATGLQEPEGAEHVGEDN